jgi:hypothetical protein
MINNQKMWWTFRNVGLISLNYKCPWLWKTHMFYLVLNICCYLYTKVDLEHNDLICCVIMWSSCSCKMKMLNIGLENVGILL